MKLKNKNLKSLGIMPTSKIKVNELFLALSRLLDMKSKEKSNHSQKVAYISVKIAEAYELSLEDIKNIFLTALVHDIGVIEEDETRKIQEDFMIDSYLVEKLSQTGYKILKKISFLPEIKRIIFFQHHNWSGNNFDGVAGDDIPLQSRIIHLADRIATLISDDIYILFQIESIIKKINSKSGFWFDPGLVKVFNRLAEKESFWLKINSGEYDEILSTSEKGNHFEINLNHLEEFASVVSHLIDQTSKFTSRHSTGVATVAAMISSELGYSQKENRVIRIAGLLHDLGKLIIPNDILEKKGELTEREYRLIKQHPYYSHQLLRSINGLGNLPEWAALHHERLDGSGYPYHLKEDEMPFGSHIMAVSDVFQALTENRPYRIAFTIEESLNILRNLGDSNKLNRDIINVLENII